MPVLFRDGCAVPSAGVRTWMCLIMAEYWDSTQIVCSADMCQYGIMTNFVSVIWPGDLDEFQLSSDI